MPLSSKSTARKAMMKNMNKIKVPDLEIGDLTEFVEKSFNDLKDDTEVYNQIKTLNVTNKIVKDNIATFLEFQEDFHYCAKCPGVSACQKERPHFQLRLSFDGKFLERSYAPCEKILRKWELDIQYPVSDFPSEWREAKFVNLDKTVERGEILVAAEKILRGDSKRWLFISGNPRMGKSYIAATIINELINAKKGPVAFLNTPARIKDLNDMAFEQKEAFKKTIDLYMSVPILVFDDFGNEYKSDYVRDTILFPILSDRSKNERLTIFTSDFTFDEIGKMYGNNANAAIRANQLKRLLMAMCKTPIELKGISVY
jgi:primosomal protein DnaI